MPESLQSQAAKPIVIHVFGNPKAQPRPRSFKRGRKVVVWKGNSADSWKQLIREAAPSKRPESLLTGPLSVDVLFLFPRPQRHFQKRKDGLSLRPNAPRYHTIKPDRDNLDKAVLDTLTELRFWKDDSQVCSGQILKTYADSAEEVGAVITILPLQDNN